MPLSVALVGLGRAGSAADEGRVVPAPRTHVGAILQASSLALTAVCDSDPWRRDGFFVDWRLKVPAYESADTLLGRDRYDVVVVATPANTHFEVLTAGPRAKPRALFGEVSCSLTSAPSR